MRSLFPAVALFLSCMAAAVASPEVTFFTYPARCQVILLKAGTNGTSVDEQLSLGTSGYVWTPSTAPDAAHQNLSAAQLLPSFLAGSKTARVLLRHDGFQ